MTVTDGPTMHFYYGDQDRPAQVNYNGTIYRYVHNLQGDIIAIVDSAGNTVVQCGNNTPVISSDFDGNESEISYLRNSKWEHVGYYIGVTEKYGQTVIETRDEKSGVIYSSLKNSTFTHYGELTGIEYR